MPIIAGSGHQPVTHTDPFGQIPNELIATVRDEDLRKLANEIFDLVGVEGRDDEIAAKINAFRTGVGALWLRLWRELDADIEAVYSTTNSFWRCLAVSVFSRRLHPQKHYRLCGLPGRGYGGLVTSLANMPDHKLQERMYAEWGKRNRDDHVNSVWRTKNQLMEKEKEYREAANVIVQIGIGWGGMWLGLIGLTLGILIPILAGL